MFSLGFDMLKKISGLFWFITDQGKTRIRRERRRGARGRGGSIAGEMQRNALVFFPGLASIQLFSAQLFYRKLMKFLLANYLSKNYYPKKRSLESTDLPDKKPPGPL